ncbi:hypothetical protein NEOC95_000603 [Neochlamydia sp. AcF95]|nr:hypothetical protein [Neochlamydia sp. AcF95]
MIKSLFLRVESAWKKANFFFGYVDVVSLKDIIYSLCSHILYKAPFVWQRDIFQKGGHAD